MDVVVLPKSQIIQFLCVWNWQETDSGLVRGHKNSNMALQWMLLGVVVVAEVVILLLLTAPLPRPLAQKVVDFVRKILQPGLAIVPFAIFQLLGQFPTTSFNPNF